jgi:thiaminase
LGDKDAQALLTMEITMLSPYALSPIDQESHTADATAAFTVHTSTGGADQERQRIETSLRETGSGRQIGHAILWLAEVAPLSKLAAFEPAALRTGVYLECFDVALDAAAGATPVLLYATARQSRLARRTTMMLDPRSATDALLTLGNFQPLPKVPALRGARLDRVLSQAAQACHEVRQPLLPSFLTGEVIETVYAFVTRMYQTGFFKAVQEGTLTREQYISVLSQSHHYVRYTTRILGRCIAHAQTPELRNHFIKHLTGEINHELIIEKDLEHLGTDPTYVREQMTPNTPTYQFLLAELCFISHFQDPLLLMAAPLAAEGIATHLQQAFVDDLQAIIACWGIEHPGQATQFVSSHINFDGGEDGHWEGSAKLLADYLTDEIKLRWFLAALAVCTEALEQCYTAGVEEMALW